MIRLLGAITGSALALATLLVFVGVPQFKFESTSPAEAGPSVVTLPLPTQPVEHTLEQAAMPAPHTFVEARSTLPEIADSAADPAAETAAEPAVSDIEPPVESAAATDIAEELGEPEHVATVPQTQVADVPQIEPDSPNWYAFWSPFRSEIAATGFVDQLERVTGLDYRVIKLKPGVYEVAFAYSDDTEIAGNLSRISAATGLDMPEG